MLIDLIETLVDRCIQLIKVREEKRRELIRDYLDPAFAQFEVLHNEYLLTFAAYRAVLRSEDVISSRLERAKDLALRDALFTAHQRTKLKHLSYFPLRLGGLFLDALRRYLSDALEGAAGTEAILDTFTYGVGNVYREGFAQTLTRIKDSGLDPVSAEETAVGALDKLVSTLQDRYSEVIVAYVNEREGL